MTEASRLALLADELNYWMIVIGSRLGPDDRKFSDTAEEAAAALRGTAEPLSPGTPVAWPTDRILKLLYNVRDYFDLNSRPENDLAHKYSKEITEISRLIDPIKPLYAAPIKSSAPAVCPSLPSGESDPAVTLDCAGADPHPRSFAYTDALENSQSLLAMIHHLGWRFAGISAEDWLREGLTKLTADQIAENRASLTATSPAEDDKIKDLIEFVSSQRQYHIDLELRDHLLKKIMALPYRPAEAASATLREALEFIVSVQEPFLSSTAYLMWNKARITLNALTAASPAEATEYDPAFVKEILDADAAEPEGTISSIEELIGPAEATPVQVREALEKAAQLLERRARGYDSHGSSIFNGTIFAHELNESARQIRALTQATGGENG